MKLQLFFLVLFFGLTVHGGTALSASDSAEDDGDDVACFTSDDGSDHSDRWLLLERSIAPCQRAFVALDQGAELDLGEKPVMQVFKSGVAAFKAKVISGTGSYTISGKTYPLKGVTLWFALNLCQRQDLVLMDANGRDVTSIQKARRIKTTDELNAIADGAELKHFENDCPKR